MSPEITIRTLTDGGQPAGDIASAVAEFVDGARRTLDIAQYDFDLGLETSRVVCDALRRAAGRGVYIRLAFNVDHAKIIPVPPPPSPDEALIASLPVDALPIAGVPDLMHHKYMVRDGEWVWTGSTNWTEQSWTRQENVIIVVRSPGLAADFHRDFDQLARAGTARGTGHIEPEWRESVRAWFTPAHGEDLSHRIGQAIGQARRRIRLCSPVLTTPPVIGALAGAVVGGRLDVTGCVDATQMSDVAHQWSASRGAWKLPLVRLLAEAGFTAKHSTPYGAGDVRDYMHAKLTIVDDTVFAGSFNLSRSGERNAENVLEIADADLADRLAGFVDEVRARYEPLSL
jgi:phosphatidylserine/phosphatidylglycerophosphate/cardiolipin synthase-like enzyme